jgi:DUF917 family protein
LDAVEQIISNYYSDHLIIMREAKVIGATNKVEDGFDVGTVILQDQANTNLTATLYFVNESLLATMEMDSIPFYFMMGPDMICSMGIDGQPMTNSEICSDFLAGKEVKISLMWVKAVDAIRTPSMFLLYAKLIAEKFGDDHLQSYRFIDDALHEID